MRCRKDIDEPVAPSGRRHQADRDTPSVVLTALAYAVFGAVAACVIDGVVLPLAIGDYLMVDIRHPISLVPMGLFGAVIGGGAGIILGIAKRVGHAIYHRHR
jgi:hypothetical protein